MVRPNRAAARPSVCRPAEARVKVSRSGPDARRGSRASKGALRLPLGAPSAANYPPIPDSSARVLPTDSLASVVSSF